MALSAGLKFVRAGGDLSDGFNGAWRVSLSHQLAYGSDGDKCSENSNFLHDCANGLLVRLSGGFESTLGLRYNESPDSKRHSLEHRGGAIIEGANFVRSSKSVSLGSIVRLGTAGMHHVAIGREGKSTAANDHETLGHLVNSLAGHFDLSLMLLHVL